MSEFKVVLSYQDAEGNRVENLFEITAETERKALRAVISNLPGCLDFEVLDITKK